MLVDDLTARFGSAELNDYDETYANGEFITDFGADDDQVFSPVSSTGSSLSSRSGTSSPSSGLSGYSTPASSDCGSTCTCERYGITRKGERVRLDCGGSRCGYDEDSSSLCSSEDEEYQTRSSRRNGIVVRA
jgi:hypothetical protein